MKTLVSVSDLSKEDILKILDYSDKFDTGKLEPYGYAKGKALGIVFLQESLRTSASLKVAMIKLGGGWVDFDLSYVKSGEEDLEDSLVAIAPMVDIIGIRGPADIDIAPIAKEISTPMVNAMIGMEHSIGVIWMAYTVWKRLGKMEGLNVGVYGLSRYSRPAIALYRILSKLGANFIEDSIIDEAGTQPELIGEIEKNGGKFSRGKLEDFIGKVDFLFVPEGLPVKGADQKIVDEFNKGYKPLNNEMLKGLREDAVFEYSMPRALTDGRLVAEKEVDSDKRLITYELMEKAIPVNMGIFAWCFE